jgi:hypothetical protein
MMLRGWPAQSAHCNARCIPVRPVRQGGRADREAISLKV